MKKSVMENAGRIGSTAVIGIFTLISLITTLEANGQGRGSRSPSITPCEKAARDLQKACREEAMAAYLVALANAKNLSDSDEQKEAEKEARDGLREALGECNEQFDARISLCEELDESRYDPEIDPDDFTLPVTNTYFPLVPGQTKIYEKETDEGTEMVVLTVLEETIEILGVECAIVQDTEFLNGVVVEDTMDYFSQHDNGDAWYFGENSLEYENGEIVSNAGSWKAGEDGAKPGIIMLASPMVGDAYRQEFFLTEAEDAGRVVALGVTVMVPFDTFPNCVQTQDFTPLEPDALENKFYAPGFGFHSSSLRPRLAAP